MSKSIALQLLPCVLVMIFLYYFHSVLTPLFVAALITYFVHPIADKLECKGLPAAITSILILLVLVLVCVGIALVIIPLIYRQLVAISYRLPEYLTLLERQISNIDILHIDREQVKEIIKNNPPSIDIVKSLSTHLVYYLNNFTAYISNYIGILVNLFVAPVFAYYLIKDRKILTQKMINLAPKKTRKYIVEKMKESDNIISMYLRAQILICTCLSLIYALGLTIVGLKSGFALGVLSGILSFIPYIGITISGGISLVFAYLQFDLSVQFIYVVLVFIVGHIIESMWLSPKFVGDTMGLHPIAFIMSIMIGAKLYGILGVFLAIPVVAIMQVWIKNLNFDK